MKITQIAEGNYSQREPGKRHLSKLRVSRKNQNSLKKKPEVLVQKNIIAELKKDYRSSAAPQRGAGRRRTPEDRLPERRSLKSK